MKTLRLLNACALLLIFTPFFQMCSDSEKVAPGRQESIRTDGIQDTLVAELDSAGLDTSIGESGESKYEISVGESFWTLITSPGDNFTLTGFGLLLLLTMEVAEGNAGDVWLSSVFTSISLLLTIATLIVLFKGKAIRAQRLTLTNLFALLAAFGFAAFTLDSLAQILWGFYLYFAVIVILFVTIGREVARAEPASPVAA